MEKYKVEFIVKETYIVDVFANNEKEAIAIANNKFDEEQYQETGDIDIETGAVYNVTNTDDPFYPSN